MRTTLKKGTKQSANENGAFPPGPLPPLVPQAATAPPPPPMADSGRSLYRVRRSPFKLLATGVIWLVVLVLVAAGALAGGVKLYFDYSVSAINATSPEVEAAAVELAELSGADKPAVAIVIGYDMQHGASAAGSRSDTVMLVRVDPEQDVVSTALVPARPKRVASRLRRPSAVDRPDQRGLRLLRRSWDGLHREGADRDPDQLPDHRQLPRVQEDRRPARRRLHGRRPAVPQRRWRASDIRSST